MTIRVTATLPGTDVELAPAADADFERVDAARAVARRRARSSSRSCAASRRAGTSIAGPAVVELPESTLAVPPGWTVRVDDSGTLVTGADA